MAILHEVGGVVECELIHLNEVAATSLSYLNLEVLILLGATFREVNVALELVVGLEDVGADVDLVVDEHPLVGIAGSFFVAVEVGSPNLPSLPVTAGIAVGVTTGYETIVSRLNGCIALEDSPCGQGVGTPLGAFAVTVIQHGVVLTAEAAATADSFVSSIDGVIHLLSIHDDVCIDTLCLGDSLRAGQLTVSLDISKVTIGIVITGSDCFLFANPVCQIGNSLISQVAAVDGQDCLVAGGKQFCIVCS